VPLVGAAETDAESVAELLVVWLDEGKLVEVVVLVDAFGAVSAGLLASAVLFSLVRR
jgi:hypothetical protein